MSSIRSAMITSFLTRYGTTAINFISVIILSRLLTPEDIGIYTVGAAVIGLAHMLRDFGVPNFVVQEKNLTVDKIRTASGLAIIVGWSLALLIFSVSEYVSQIYDEDGIKDVLRILALNFVLIPIGVISPALLRRDMNYKSLFIIHISSTSMNSSLTIVLALLGYGYMSMAWGSVVGILTNVLISMYFLPSQYRKYPTIKEWRKITNFSLYNTLVLIMRELGKEGSNLLIGKLTNLESLGLYSRAYGYMDIFRRIAVDAILPVIHSKLSIDNRSGISLSEPYIKIFEIVIGVGIPGYLFLSIMSEPLIMVLYGNQWISAASVASILCITGILTLITLVNAQMLLAVGEVKKLAIVNVIIQPIKLVVILMVAANGLVSVAVGLLISEIIHVIYSQKYVIKSINLNIQAWRKGFFKCLVLGGLTAIGPLSVRIYVSSTHLILILIIAITTSIIGWLAGMWLTGHPLKYEIISMASTIKGRIIHQN